VADESQPRLRVLVVDDDAVFGDLTLRRLERMDIDAKLNLGPTGVMYELLNGRFDAVIVDVQMPGISGPEVAQMIRSSTSRGVKILFYSSLESVQLRRLAEAHGADGYLPKAATGKELEIRLREVVGLRGMASLRVPPT
jgi:DNA-binding response OmpR family regulator